MAVGVSSLTKCGGKASKSVIMVMLAVDPVAPFLDLVDGMSLCFCLDFKMPTSFK